MKKQYFFIMTLIACTGTVQAQEPADALRLSWVLPNGTARQMAVGGAMGSLGGDLSAAFMNPAGLGFYRTGDFVLSPGFQFLNTEADYLGRSEEDKRSTFTFGTSGFVLGGSDGGSRNHAFAVAVTRSASFGNNILYRGENTYSSYSQRFLEEISGDGDANSVAGNYPLGASLAFNTYWIDTVAGGMNGNFQYQSRAGNILLQGGSLLQEQVVENRGGITEFAIAGATNFNDKLYFGGTLGIPLVSYDRDARFIEADASDDVTNMFDFASFEENLRTRGVGINLKAGIIYKPIERVRLGFAVHSPSFYSLTDNYSSVVTTDTENYQGLLTDYSEDYLGGPTEFSYLAISPYRLMVSASYVLREISDVTKQRGFLTADVEYVNHKASSFHASPEDGSSGSATKAYLKEVNRAIDNAYKGTFNFRVGGELKFTTIMVRAGAAYYGNPYQDINGEEGSRTLFSGGLGYRNKGMFIDLTYTHQLQRDVHSPYRFQGAYPVAELRNQGGNVMLSIGFKI